MGKRKPFCSNESLLFVLVSSSLFFSGIQAAAQHENSPSKQPASQEEAEPPDLKFFTPGALTFGDLYAVPSHHLPEAEDKAGFWIRRIYLTGDFNLSKQIFVRARFEANQDGDFVSNGFTGDIKDLFLRWTIGRHKLFFGLTPTPTFDLVEDHWGFRYLEKTPLDLQGEPSRDWGIAARGPLSQKHQINYRIMLGIRLELGRETGEGSRFMGAVSYGNPKKGLLLDLYGDFQKLPGPTDHTTGQISLHYSLAKGRVGGLYYYQDREADPRLEVASAFGVADLFSKVSLVGRVDRLMAPSPRGNDIDYLPFDPNSRATLLIGGLEWRPCAYFSLTPNLETILYDRNLEGYKPKNDLLLRLTFYVHY